MTKLGAISIQFLSGPVRLIGSWQNRSIGLKYVTDQASQGNTRDINLKRDVPQTIKVRATEKKYWHMCVLKIYCSKKCGVPLWHARCAIGVSRWDERPDVRAAPSSLARPLLCHFSFCHVSLRACGIFSVRHARAWHTR